MNSSFQEKKISEEVFFQRALEDMKIKEITSIAIYHQHGFEWIVE